MPPSTQPPNKVLSPAKFAHVVLRTNNFEQMKQYYKTFLGGYAQFENETLSFITYDEEHHRVALVNMPHLEANKHNSIGLEHIAYTFASLKDLCTAYRQRKAVGITPGWCVHHGPTISFYYQDPDGNRIETQVDVFDDAEKANEMMYSAAFKKNAIGADIDPEELCRQVEAGVDEEELKVRPDVGERGLEDIKQVMEQLVTTSRTGF